MLKGLLVFILGLMCWQGAEAQKRDSTLLYMKNSGQILETKDSADYFLLIMFPADSSSGVKINSVEEFYRSGKRKLIGTARINVFDNNLFLRFNGPCVSFYQNGRRKSIMNYRNGIPYGDQTLYYPNGELYASEKYDEKFQHQLIACYDSTGKVLAAEGNGLWLKFDDDVKNKIEEGPVKDGLEDGEWHGFINDTAKYINVYKKGVFVSSTNPNVTGQIFVAVEQEPTFKNGGAAGFNAYLSRAVKFPASDRENGTQGKVIVTFVVEKDGSLTGIHALRAPSQQMADAVIKAVQQSPPWRPGMQNGRPVRVQFTMSFAFSLADN